MLFQRDVQQDVQNASTSNVCNEEVVVSHATCGRTREQVRLAIAEVHYSKCLWRAGHYYIILACLHKSTDVNEVLPEIARVIKKMIFVLTIV